MSPEQRRYLIVQGCLGPVIVNAIINAAIGWAITDKYPRFPVWKAPGVMFDLAATAFGVAFGTCLLIGIQIKKDVDRGKVRPPPLSLFVSRVLGLFPEGTLRRSCWIGAWSVPVFVPPVAAVILIMGATTIDRVSFTAMKAGLSAVEAALVTPLIVLRVLLDLSSREAPKPPPVSA